MEKYQIRNVSEREIYDSYMGNMRISPNPVSQSNQRLVDDPTNHLNSILNVDVLTKKQTQTEIVLSDSDGNQLPIKFIPKAKYTKTMVCEGESKFIDESYPLINIVTELSESAKLFVSNNFNSYSTIYIDNREENEKGLKVSSLQFVSKDGAKENILLYPIESPHDEGYFNDKNKLELVDYNSAESYKSQMENALLKKSGEWYSKNSIHFKNGDKDERVVVDGKYVTTFNEDGEVIPILQTRDYVLGHYEGHTMKVNDRVKNDWIGFNSHAYDRGDIDSVTKLSWVRFDNLIWDVVSNVLKGEVRHKKGRYIGLGADENNSIMEKLFGGGPSNPKDGDFTLKYDLGANDWMDYSSPLLGEGVQRGLILYNAIPFRRYMFHVARQICSNLSYQFKSDENGAKDWNVAGDKSDMSEVREWSVFDEIAAKLSTYFKKKIITKAPQGAVSSIHSLVKDFLLCDGKEISYKNYPNINISNKKIFDFGENGEDKLLPDVDEDKKTFVEIEVGSETFDKLNNSILKSSPNGLFETPHLYTILEKSPRLIRALNWEFNDKDVLDNVVNMTSNANENSYISTIKDGPCESYISINGERPKQDEDGKDLQNEIFVGEGTSNIIKDISAAGLYFYNYDSMIKRNDHYHPSFSSESGIHSTGEVSKKEKEVLTACVNYQTGKKRGGKNYSVDHKTALNHDYTHNVSGDNSKNWIDYCFNKNSINKYEGYSPIPNGGLYLFNAVLFNSIRNSEKDTDYCGTTEYIESEISKGNYVYYDGENTAHTIYGMTKKVDLISQFLKIVYMGREIEDENGNIVKEEYLNKNPEPPTITYTIVDSNGKEQTKEREATIEDGDVYWSNIDEVVAKSNYHTRDYLAGDLYKGLLEKGGNLLTQRVCVLFREIFSKHVEEKKIRRLQIIKMNESEGRIPASANGGPLYVSWVNWSRTERRNSKKKRRKEYNFKWKGVGNYNIGVNDMRNDSEVKGDYQYRCLTSIAYQNSKKLGTGDVKSELKDDYFNKNSVTTPLEEVIHPTVSFGGIEFDVSQIDMTAPSPDYVNLLPLIRI